MSWNHKKCHRPSTLNSTSHTLSSSITIITPNPQSNTSNLPPNSKNDPKRGSSFQRAPSSPLSSIHSSPAPPSSQQQEEVEYEETESDKFDELRLVVRDTEDTLNEVQSTISGLEDDLWRLKRKVRKHGDMLEEYIRKMRGKAKGTEKNKKKKLREMSG